MENYWQNKPLVVSLFQASREKAKQPGLELLTSAHSKLSPKAAAEVCAQPLSRRTVFSLLHFGKDLGPLWAIPSDICVLPYALGLGGAGAPAHSWRLSGLLPIARASRALVTLLAFPQAHALEEGAPSQVPTNGRFHNGHILQWLQGLLCLKHQQILIQGVWGRGRNRLEGEEDELRIGHFKFELLCVI